MMTFIRSIENCVLQLSCLAWILAGFVGLSCTSTERPSALVATTVSVPPFLESIVFDLESARPGALTVQPRGGPAAVALGALADSRLRTSPSLTSLEVRRPVPGVWRFAGLGEPPKVRIREKRSYLRGRLLEPGGRVVPRDGDCSLVYEIYDVFGESLPDTARHALDARAQVLAPNGAEESRQLVPSPAPEGVLRFRDPQLVRCNQAGRYWVVVEVSAADSEGRSIELFRDGGNGFILTSG